MLDSIIRNWFIWLYSTRDIVTPGWNGWRPRLLGETPEQYWDRKLP
jgi:hypothetical protein